MLRGSAIAGCIANKNTITASSYGPDQKKNRVIQKKQLIKKAHEIISPMVE